MNVLTLEDWFTSSDKYKWRALHKERTKEIEDNALDLVTRINYFLKEVGYYGQAKFSSGFRPHDVNKLTPGASKKSGHMNGGSGDLEDKERELALLVLSNLKLLEKHGLWLEDPKKTEGWIHVQNYPPKSGNRVFLP